MTTEDLKWIEMPAKEGEKIEDLYSARGIICESLAFMLGEKYSENQQLEKEVSTLKEELLSVEKNWSEAVEDNDNLVALLRDCILHREQTIADQEKLLDEHSQKIQGYSSKIAEFEEESKQKDEKIQFLEKQLENAAKNKEEKLQEVEKKWWQKLRKLEEKTERSSGILDSLVELTKKNEKLAGKLQRRDKMIADLQRQISSLEKEKEEREEFLEPLYTTATEEFADISETVEENMFFSASDEFYREFPEFEGGNLEKITVTHIENEKSEELAKKEETDPFKETVKQENEEESDLDEIEWDLVMEAFNNCYTDLQSTS